MQNNLFYSRESNKKENKFDFKKKKENVLASFYEVENFLLNYKKIGFAICAIRFANMHSPR